MSAFTMTIKVQKILQFGIILATSAFICSSMNAEMAMWSDELSKSDNSRYLTQTTAPAGYLPTTPDFYNPDGSSGRKINYNDFLLMKINGTDIELGAIKNNPAWSGTTGVIHKLMTFSMSNQDFPLEIRQINDPWEVVEPRLSNWHQVANIGRTDDKTGDNLYWITSTIRLRNMFHRYKETSR